MIRHIVVWRLAGETDADRDAAAREIAQLLGALIGHVPGLIDLSVDRDVGDTDGNYDLVLVSHHEDATALAAYQQHPDHQRAAARIRELTRERAAIDSAVS